MGKKREWFSALLNKAIICDSKRKHRKSRRRRLGKQRSTAGREQLMEAEHEQNRHAYSVAVATAAAAVAAANAAAEVVRLRAAACHSGRSVQEIAAVRIQTAFRGYLARRALRALRGLARLKSLIKKGYAKRQAATTLKWMQTVARVQYEVRAARITNSTLHQQILHQTSRTPMPRDFTNRMTIDGWDNNTQSKEQIEANRVHKQEAAVRRERAMAYAHSHQKIALKNSTEPCTDPKNPGWGWNWLERWMAGRTWENDNKPIVANDGAIVSTKIGINNSPALVVKRAKPQPSPSTPKSKSVAKIRPLGTLDDDTRSVTSAQSRRSRRHGGGSVAGSSVRDDESCASSSSAAGVPSYMASTESARAKSRMSSLSAKKRLSFSGSPGRGSGDRRRSRIDVFPADNVKAC